jgi:hypothetical protein
VRRRLISLGIAVAIVCVAFPEVVFLGGSLSPVGLTDTLTHGRDIRVVRVYPNLRNRAPDVDVRDIDARDFQLVPATKFMHRAITDGESPWWNPYSAAGSYGPETLADMKLSPFVLAVAALGASATAFTFVILLFVVIALYCLQQLIAYRLRLGRAAAIAACTVWLLTGFGASDINSATGGPYLLFPVLLYALVVYSQRGGVVRFVAALAAWAAFLLTTFGPSQLLLLVVVYAVVLLVDAPCWPAGQSAGGRARTIARRHLVVPVVAILLTAYVWLPDLAVVAHGSSSFAKYGRRSLTLTGPLSYLRRIVSPAAIAGGPHWLTYVGIVPVLAIAAAWSTARGLQRRLLTTTGGLALFALALHAGIPVIRLVGDLPGLRAIRQDYWAVLAGAAETVAIAVAIAVIAARGVSRTAVWCTSAFLVVWLFGTAVGEWMVGHPGMTAAVCVATALIIGTAVLLSRATERAHRRMVAVVAVGLIAVELLAYQNHARPARFDPESPTPRYVAFLEHHLDGDRILDAGRGALYPEWGSALGIPQIETLNVSQLPAYRAFYQQYIVPQHGLFLEVGAQRGRSFKVQPTALDLLSVRYIVTDGSVKHFDAGVKAHYRLVFRDRRSHVAIYENPHAFPRAYLSPVLTAHGSPGRFSARVTRTTDAELLAAARTAGIPTAATPGATARPASVTRYDNTKVEVSVDAARPSVLVLTDTYAYGWHVSVNGRAQHLARVDDVVRGVVVPAGKSTVVFTYRLPPRTVGAAISLLTIVGLLAYGAWLVIRRARSPRVAKPGADPMARTVDLSHPGA